MVDYARTALASSLATAATGGGALTLTLLARETFPTSLFLVLVSLSGLSGLLGVVAAVRTLRGRVRQTLAVSQTAAFLGIGLLLAPFLLDPAGASAKPLLSTLLLAAGLILATFSGYTSWCSVAAPIAVPWLSRGAREPATRPAPARAPGRVPR